MRWSVMLQRMVSNFGNAAAIMGMVATLLMEHYIGVSFFVIGEHLRWIYQHQIAGAV